MSPNLKPNGKTMTQRKGNSIDCLFITTFILFVDDLLIWFLFLASDLLKLKKGGWSEFVSWFFVRTLKSTG
jgi:hypothetical protein